MAWQTIGTIISILVCIYAVCGVFYMLCDIPKLWKEARDEQWKD